MVYLAVPNNQHARYAKVALEAGKHVIVEKADGRERLTGRGAGLFGPAEKGLFCSKP